MSLKSLENDNVNLAKMCHKLELELAELREDIDTYQVCEINFKSEIERLAGEVVLLRKKNQILSDLQKDLGRVIIGL